MPPETLEGERTYNPFDLEKRRYHDITTWGAEMLDGNMRTQFEYKFDGQELYAGDGSSIGEIFNTAFEDAHTLAEKEPLLAFEIRRRACELEEYNDMIEMAKGLGSNTMVVVSDYPKELIDVGKDVGGYNHRRMQTMLRVITRTEEDTIKIQSQTLDRSDRAGLESIYEFFGTRPEHGELLGQRLYVDIDESRQANLTDELVAEYDHALEEKYLQPYFAGRSPAEIDNTYNFVIKQDDLIDAYLQSPNSENKYAFAAALDKRWINRNYQLSSTQSKLTNVEAEMHREANLARIENKVFSGCGASLSANVELDSLGYGNKTQEELSWHGGVKKVGTCVNCKDKTTVGKENWCKGCIKGHCG